MRFIHGIALSLALCAGAAKADEHISADTVVATVGDTEITLAHMIVLKSRLPQEYQSLPAPIIWEGVLDQLVQQTLLGQTIDQMTAGSQAVLDNEERALRASEAIIEIGEAAATDEAIEAAYAEMVDGQAGEKEWNVDHILFQQEEGAEPGAAEAEAVATISDLEGGADFATLARERSDGPSGPSGGELGWFGRGALVPEFEQAMAAMEPGTISSEPVQTRFGWHIIRLNDVRNREAPPLEEVRTQLVEEVRRAAIDARIAEIQAGVEVTRTPADQIDPAVLDNVDLLRN